ncbi:hypothetical protein DMB44_04115 [Thermoplasma sp. Kam2015]|uniref:zinc-ribbon domain-containing protein n=1 Tax=Thermoplasma sp. Kam2015 TaxID=2094122 RepID=UPI000D8B03E2|nr:zinc-ribbon domain-containing protein [Thermoplasma sp. Kam2015]PYB68526.1 hypothetical protein DMB44_04115 [Thermoplasma sp. Kam2015]
MDILDVLSQKYATSMLLFLLDRSNAKQYELLDIIPSNMTIEKLSKLMEEAGLIEIKRKFAGHRYYSFSLTPKGRAVAEQLKKAQEIAENPDAEKHEPAKQDIQKIEITEEATKRVADLRLLFHVNVMDDHVTIEEIPQGGGRPRIFNVYVKRNGHGDFRLWCEQDNSFDCVHVEVAWTYPEVQRMMMHYRGKTKICPYCHTENDSDALFCKHCGAKLE